MQTERHVADTAGITGAVRGLFGRRQLFTEFDRIDEGNVVKAIEQIKAEHNLNVAEIEYLERYLRGDQPILKRIKEIRGDILDNTVVNHALEIKTFWTSYSLAEPIVYVSRKETKASTTAVNKLNDYMYLAGKDAVDKSLFDDFTTCGVAYRFVYPNEEYTGNSDKAPFITCSMKPNSTFVVYKHSALRENKPVFAGSIAKKDGKTVYDIYTPELHMTVVDDKVVSSETNAIGMIPIIEYTFNELRMGSFEPVLSMMDSRNVLESNRVEAVEQNVQHLTWFNNVTLDAADLERLNQQSRAFIFTKSVDGQAPADIKTIMIELMQADQQVLANDLYRNILTITGLPSVGDGNTSDSSNNGSTLVRNGWEHAEGRAKDTATLFEESDKKFLAIVISICQKLAGLKLSLTDVKGKFTRRNYSDVQSKMTVLTTALGCDKIHPKMAYQTAGLFPDPEEAYSMGMAWMKSQQKTENDKTGGESSDSADEARGNESPA